MNSPIKLPVTVEYVADENHCTVCEADGEPITHQIPRKAADWLCEALNTYPGRFEKVQECPFPLPLTREHNHVRDAWGTLICDDWDDYQQLDYWIRAVNSHAALLGRVETLEKVLRELTEEAEFERFDTPVQERARNVLGGGT